MKRHTMSSEDIRCKTLFPKKCCVCRKYYRDYYHHVKKKTGGIIILCRNCQLILMCSSILSK